MRLADPVAVITRWARSLMDTCCDVPMFTARPSAAPQPASRMSAGITSSTWQKQRICSPVPNTVTGCPASACRTNRGTTIP
jgi:hypothetical protein